MIPLTLQQHKDTFSRIETLFMFGQLKFSVDLLTAIGHTYGELEYAYDSPLHYIMADNLEEIQKPITQKDIQNEKEKYFNYLTYYLTTYKVERQSTYGDRDTTGDQETYDQLFYKEDTHNKHSCAISSEQCEVNKETVEECQTISNLEQYRLPQGNIQSNYLALKDAFEQEDTEKDQSHLPWHKQDYHKPIPLLQRAKDLTFFIHQKKAIRELFTKIVDDKLRAVLLQAGTGTGKTFIAGGLIEQLWNKDLQFFAGCISPWPCVYITRASIVEQTARVMENKFNLDPVRQCYVMNIEQMRAKFGEYFLREKVKVVKGEEVVEWTWIPFMAPRLIILDESHLAKNERSTQSQIVQAISDLPNTILLAMSATSFMRVIEARYFCVNTHKEL